MNRLVIVFQKRLFRISLAMLLFGLLVYLTAGPLASHIEETGIWLAERVGLPGVFVYVYVVDTLIVPAAVDLLFPFVSGWAYIPLVLILSTASIAGGVTGYLIGRNLNRIRVVDRVTTRYRVEHADLFVKYGRRTVIIAALLPVPFSTISWLAGSFEMPLRDYLLGAMFRLPRMIITLWMFQRGIAFFS